MTITAKIPYEAKCNLTTVTFVRYLASQLDAEFRAKGWRRIGVLGPRGVLTTLKRWLPDFNYVLITTEERWGAFEDFDIVLDFLLDTYMRRLLPGGHKCVSLSDLMLPLAMVELCEFVRQKGAELLLIDGPRSERVKNLDPTERRYIEGRVSFVDIAEDAEFVRRFCSNEEDFNYARCRRLGVFGGWQRQFNGIFECLADVRSDFINVSGGVRLTVGAPDSPDSFVHFFGSCLAQGSCVTDGHTIESYLQRRFNQERRNRAVVNRGVGDGRFLLNDLIGAMTTPINDADVIVIIDDFSKLTLHDIITSSDWFECKGCDEVMFFNNAYHTNAKANELLASHIGDMIGKRVDKSVSHRINWFSSKGLLCEPSSELESYNDCVVPYLRYISRMYACADTDCAAVLVNADPFTLGHRHLVETALTAHKHVYVFLLDQDAFFTFRERYDMAVLGCKGLSATVIKTEDFYASARNFPEYFNRNQYVPGAELSATVEHDLRMFNEKVFPFLGIRARYLGEEEPSSVTGKYNELVCRIDSEYGIATKVIPRFRVHGRVVSASVVRASFAKGDLLSCRDLVTDGVFAYLQRLLRERR